MVPAVHGPLRTDLISQLADRGRAVGRQPARPVGGVDRRRPRFRRGRRAALRWRALASLRLRQLGLRRDVPREQQHHDRRLAGVHAGARRGGPRPRSSRRASTVSDDLDQHARRTAPQETRLGDRHHARDRSRAPPASRPSRTALRPCRCTRPAIARRRITSRSARSLANRARAATSAAASCSRESSSAGGAGWAAGAAAGGLRRGTCGAAGRPAATLASYSARNAGSVRVL